MVERIGQQIGNYRLVRALGHGGFADVYLGEHVYLKTQAAIKILHTHLDEEGIEQFRTEAQTIAHLVHPHIIRVLDFDVEEDNPFLVMDYAPQGTLRQRHPKNSILPPEVFLPYVKQVASALHYAHQHNLIHRDVKPENMLIGAKDDILLSDFGIALIAQSSRSQTTEDIVIGTMAYMAPEQIQGRPRPASDQYALAVVTYEWLCGRRPFYGSYVEIVTQHLSAPPPALHEQTSVPPAVEQVINKALSKDFRQRFADIQEFADALEQAYQQPASIEQLPAYSQPEHSPDNGTSTLHQTTIASNLSTITPSIYIQRTRKVIKKSLRTAAIIAILCAILLCGVGVAGFRYVASFLPHAATTAGSGTAAGVEVANDFLQALSRSDYAHAYNDFNPSLKSQVSNNEFIQQARLYDRCNGPITQFTKDSDMTVQNNNEVYSYTIARQKLSQTYHMKITVQKDTTNTWLISNYTSTSATPSC